MTFDEFINNYNLVSAWFTSVGNPTGIQIFVDVDEDCCDEDYCDEQMLLDAIPSEGDLVGTVTTDEFGNSRWGVDSLQGSAIRDCRGNNVTNLVVFGRK